MSDSKDKPTRIQEDLARAGEAAASEAELEAAERLAERLDGGLAAAGDAEEEGLFSLSQAMREQETPARTEAVVRRTLDAVFAAPEQDAAPTDLERHTATALGREVDRLMAGCAPDALAREEVAELARWATIVRAGSHSRSASPSRVRQLVDSAVAGQEGAPQPAAPIRLSRGGLMGGLLVAVLIGLFIAGAMLFTLRRAQAPEAPKTNPTHLSRSTRDVLPGPFPRTQTQTDRMNIIYRDRLRAYRDRSLSVKR